MSGLLRGSCGAIIRQVVPFTVHDQPHVQVHYSPADDENRVVQARLGNEATYEGIQAGDRVIVHSLMNVVTKIEKA